MRTLFISVIISLFFFSCVSYSHIIDASKYDAPQKQMSENYSFAGTHAFDLQTIEKIRSQYEDANGNLSEENKKKLDSLFVMKTPTYFELGRNIKHKYGQNATFANVVWDIKHSKFLNFKSEKPIAVTFDLYLPKK